MFSHLKLDKQIVFKISNPIMSFKSDKQFSIIRVIILPATSIGMLTISDLID